MSVYYELAGHAAAIVDAVSSGDDYTASARSRAMKDTVKRMDDKQPYSPFHLSLIFSSLLKLPIETEEDVNLQLEIALRIKDIYGENHIVLGDLCEYTSRCIATQLLHLPLLCFRLPTGGPTWPKTPLCAVVGALRPGAAHSREPVRYPSREDR